MAVTTLISFIPLRGIARQHEPSKDFYFMKLIPLTQGFFAKVDDEDFDLINGFKWHYAKMNASSNYAMKRNGEKQIGMHRLIMKQNNSKIFIDHIDGDGLNNQKANLRECSQHQNAMNIKKKRGSSKFVGVYFHITSKKWRAICYINKRRTNVGSFKTELEAAKRRDEFAKIHYGVFANLNF